MTLLRTLYVLVWLGFVKKRGFSRGLAPEVVHFRIPSDGMDANVQAPSDWYIKGAG